MAEAINQGTDAIINAFNQSASNTIAGITAATKDVQSEVSDLNTTLTSKVADLSDTVVSTSEAQITSQQKSNDETGKSIDGLSKSINNAAPTEEDKAEEKRSKLKMLGVLGVMAGALIKLPLTLAKTTIKAGAAGKGLLGGLLANEFVESLAGAAKTIIAPVASVVGKIAAPILKTAGKFGLVAAGVFAAVEGVKGAFEGVSRAGEIFGVEQEQATASQKISAGIGGFVEGIAQAPATLLKMLGMEELAKKWTTFIDQFDITEKIAHAIEPTVAKLVEFFGFLKPVFTKLYDTALKLKPIIEPILTGILGFFTGTIEAVFTKIREIGFFQKFEDLILTIGTIVGDIWKSIDESGVLPQLRTFFVDVIIGGIGELMTSLTTALEAAKPTIVKVVKILTSIIQFITPILKSLALDVIFPLIKVALKAIVGIFNFLGGGLAKLLAPFTSGEQSPEEQGKAFVSKVKEIFSAIFGFFKNLSWENIVGGITGGIKDVGKWIGDQFINIFTYVTDKFALVVTTVKNALVKMIRKIPLMEKFGMTDEEKADVDRREQIRKDIQAYASTFSINPLGESQKKQMQDTQNIQGILERSSREDIAALLQGNKLNENARLELAKLFNENKQLYEEIKTAKDKLNATIITQGGSTQTTVNSTTVAIAKGATDPSITKTEAALAN